MVNIYYVNSYKVLQEYKFKSFSYFFIHSVNVFEEYIGRRKYLWKVGNNKIIKIYQPTLSLYTNNNLQEIPREILGEILFTSNLSDDIRVTDGNLILDGKELVKEYIKKSNIKTIRQYILYTNTITVELLRKLLNNKTAVFTDQGEYIAVGGVSIENIEPLLILCGLKYKIKNEDKEIDIYQKCKVNHISSSIQALRNFLKEEKHDNRYSVHKKTVSKIL